MGFKKLKINEQIIAPEVRVVDAEGKNLGVMSKEAALVKAKEANLDLIEISSRVVPPITKIMDYGKYCYQAEKKEKNFKKPSVQEFRSIRITLAISQRDLELKAKKANEFLNEGSRVKIELLLVGRAKYLDRNFLIEKLKKILDFITVPYQETIMSKATSRGIYFIIEKK